jgi:hypothetical protein
LAEGSEFELPVPVSKLSDDSIMLEVATARRVAAIARGGLINRESEIVGHLIWKDRRLEVRDGCRHPAKTLLVVKTELPCSLFAII